MGTPRTNAPALRRCKKLCCNAHDRDEVKKKHNHKNSGGKESPAKKKTSPALGAAKNRTDRRVASAHVDEELHEMKEGTLRSGSTGKKVTNRKQAIAIGLSEARRSGKYPSCSAPIAGAARPETKRNGVSASLLVKFGGSVVRGDAGDPVLRDLVALTRAGIRVALVHGGGPAVDAELRARKIATKRLAGLRVTDAATLSIVVDVLGRKVNAAIVAALVAAGSRPMRVGGDEGVFFARRLVSSAGDLGFVGEIERVEALRVFRAMERGAIPVVSPIGIDAGGQRWNINADTAAGALAAALAVETYVVITDVPRVRVVRDDPTTGITRMTLAEADGYRERGVFSDGMIPKIDAALAALRGGVPRALICGAGPGAIQAALAGAGTEIVP